MRRLLVWCVLLLVCSCAPPPGKPGRDVDALQQAARSLPGAVVSAGEPLTISYPAGVLFSSRSVLPLPGGLEVLDPLAGLLAEPGSRWHVLVRAASGRGSEYDQQLAAARVELLKRFLTSRNLSLQAFSWETASADGAPLELVLESAGQPSPASSSGVKR